MNPKDAKARKLRNGSKVKLSTRRGEVTTRVDTRGRNKPPEGLVFIAFFDPSRLVNKLTLDQTDPLSKETDYKKVRLQGGEGLGRHRGPGAGTMTDAPPDMPERAPDKRPISRQAVSRGHREDRLRRRPGWPRRRHACGRAKSLPADAIRPPGALPEKDDFLASCVRCGLCVRDCPYDILKLAELGENVATGTPYFTARTGPCEMCEDIPCVPACPTGALDHGLTDITKAKMGLAVLIDKETCIAFQGLRCEVCFNVCPVRGEAIKLEYRHNAALGQSTPSSSRWSIPSLHRLRPVREGLHSR